MTLLPRLILPLLAAGSLGVAGGAAALNVLEVRVERATLFTAGVQVLVAGDTNGNATAGVRLRAANSGTWRAGPPLFRVEARTQPPGVDVPDQLAGSVFDLEPGREYELELRFRDPDGPVDERRIVPVRTRPLPRRDPLAARLRRATTVAELRAAAAEARAGEVILLARGTYTLDTLTLRGSGTAENPIILRGEARDEVVFDGGGTAGNVIEAHGSHLHLEDFTVRNAYRGIRLFGASNNVVRRVRLTDVTHGIAAGAGPQLDFLLADNVVEGRRRWPWVFAAAASAHWDERGISVNGHGHVVCHNFIRGFGDALLNLHGRARACDFHGNDIHDCHDGVELDRGEGNVRCFGNRWVNVASAISLQPVVGGPVYVLRNGVINAVHDQLKYKQTGTEPSGALAHHNTFVSARRALDLQTPVTTHHFRIVNNLFLGPPAPEAGSSVEWTAGVRAGEFDHNGYFPDGRFWFGTVAGRRRVFEHFAAVRQAGEVERHGVLLSASPLASGALGTPDGRRAAPPGTFALRPDSEAVDRGVLLPGLNDRHAGAAPDLGAHELGAEEPWYGPRPEGREHLTNLVNAPPAADGGRTSRRGVTRLPR